MKAKVNILEYIKNSIEKGYSVKIYGDSKGCVIIERNEATKTNHANCVTISEFNNSMTKIK